VNARPRTGRDRALGSGIDIRGHRPAHGGRPRSSGDIRPSPPSLGDALARPPEAKNDECEREHGEDRGLPTLEGPIATSGLDCELAGDGVDVSAQVAPDPLDRAPGRSATKITSTDVNGAAPPPSRTERSITSARAEHDTSSRGPQPSESWGRALRLADSAISSRSP
jgi:hypothetical protein